MFICVKTKDVASSPQLYYSTLLPLYDTREVLDAVFQRRGYIDNGFQSNIQYSFSPTLLPGEKFWTGRLFRPGLLYTGSFMLSMVRIISTSIKSFRETHF